MEHQVQAVRTKLLGIANNRRNENLRRWLSQVEFRLRCAHPGDIQKDVFKELMSKYSLQIAQGTLQANDFQIASQIASGALAGDAVVAASSQSYFAMLDKHRRGKLQRVTTAKFFNADLAQEFLSEVRSLLALCF